MSDGSPKGEYGKRGIPRFPKVCTECDSDFLGRQANSKLCDTWNVDKDMFFEDIENKHRILEKVKMFNVIRVTNQLIKEKEICK